MDEGNKSSKESNGEREEFEAEATEVKGERVPPLRPRLFKWAVGKVVGSEGLTMHPRRSYHNCPAVFTARTIACAQLKILITATCGGRARRKILITTTCGYVVAFCRLAEQYSRL